MVMTVHTAGKKDQALGRRRWRGNLHRQIQQGIPRDGWLAQANPIAYREFSQMSGLKERAPIGQIQIACGDVSGGEFETGSSPEIHCPRPSRRLAWQQERLVVPMA